MNQKFTKIMTKLIDNETLTGGKIIKPTVFMTNNNNDRALGLYRLLIKCLFIYSIQQSDAHLQC